jgi:septum formation protein
VAVARDGRIHSAVEEAEVAFHTLSEDDIRAYIATQEPMDKAGAYGIQGFGATIVAGVNGDYFAVMGLPLQLLVRLLPRVGANYNFGALEDG